MTENTAVFFDLQGTLGGEGLGDILHFTFFAHAIEAIKLVNDGGFLSVVITNQSHISRGDFTDQQFWDRIAALQNELLNYGTRIDGVYCCPHSAKDNCNCMKPRPGLVLAARKDLGLDLGRC